MNAPATKSLPIIQSISAADLPKRGQPLAGGTFVTRYWRGQSEFALIDLGAAAEIEGKWGEYGQEVPGVTDYSDGYANTITMAEAGSELAKKVLELGAYIPAPLEGQLLMAAKREGLIGGFNEDRWYYLSAQYSADSAYNVDFFDGVQGILTKYDERLVRPVRSVPIQ